MRGKLLVTFLLGNMAALADVCPTASLTSYEGLGTGGCTVTGLPFSGFNFTALKVTGGATPVDPANITVTPVDPDVAAGLDFSSDGFDVDSGQFAQYQLSYSVDDPPIIHEFDLDLVDPVTPPGNITITTVECLGAAFVETTCPTGITVTNTVSDNGIISVPSDNVSFGAVRTMGVLTTITLDASAGGSASFSSFGETAMVAPEPWSILLTGSILLFLLLKHRVRS
jgi:hypothetical protein